MGDVMSAPITTSFSVIGVLTVKWIASNEAIIGNGNHETVLLSPGRSDFTFFFVHLAITTKGLGNFSGRTGAVDDGTRQIKSRMKKREKRKIRPCRFCVQVPPSIILLRRHNCNDKSHVTFDSSFFASSLKCLQFVSNFGFFFVLFFFWREKITDYFFFYI